MKDFVVVSLFDGISIAMSSLNRLGIYPTKYYASEVDSYANSISKYNFPDIIRLGDVTKITGDEIKEPVDLLIGGSPCQGFSFTGNMLQFSDPRSKLFFEYVRLLKILKPKHFLLENVKMPKRSSQVISDMLGVDYVEINSNLLSAQNRPRLYWSNLKINQPKPKNILLLDILLDGQATEEMTSKGKSYCLTVSYLGAVAWNSIQRKQRTMIKVGDTYRKLHAIEGERLQTLPDNYTALGIDNSGNQIKISKRQRFKTIGNGFTADVISWILSPLLQDQPKTNNERTKQMELF